MKLADANRTRVVIEATGDLCPLCDNLLRPGQVVLRDSNHHMSCATARWVLAKAFPKELTPS